VLALDSNKFQAADSVDPLNAGEFGQTMWVFKEFHRVLFAGIVFSLMVFVC
jgi:hypothetical protein